MYLCAIWNSIMIVIRNDYFTTFCHRFFSFILALLPNSCIIFEEQLHIFLNLEFQIEIKTALNFWAFAIHSMLFFGMIRQTCNFFFRSEKISKKSIKCLNWNIRWSMCKFTWAQWKMNIDTYKTVLWVAAFQVIVMIWAYVQLQLQKRSPDKCQSIR